MSVENEIVPLKDLCEDYKSDIVDGPFGSNLKRDDYKEQGLPVLKIQNISPFEIVLKKMDYVTPEKYKQLKRHSFTQGDIIMTKLGDPLGASAIVDGIEDGLIVADLVRIRLGKINKKYLCYHLNSPITNNFINSKQRGTTRPRVRISDVRELPIYNPPLKEQNKIVEILDEAFKAIDQAKANIEQNIQNAEELFKSKLNAVFSQRGEGWKEMQVHEVCNEIFAGGDAPKANFSKEKNGQYKIPIYANAVKHKGLYGYTDRARVTESAITIAARGSGTGYTEIREDPFFPIVRLIVLVPRTGEIRLRFLKYSIDNIKILRSGTAIPQLTVPMIKKHTIIVPPLVEQKKAEDLFDKLKSELDNMTSFYHSKKMQLDILKKSLLQKAFSGELTKNEEMAA